LIVLGATVAAVATAGELVMRGMDGYRLTTLHLVPVKPVETRPAPLTEWPTAGADAIAAPHLKDIPVPAGVDRQWFGTDPAPPPPKPPRPDLEALSRGAGDPALAKFARRRWNLNFVVDQAKRRERSWQFLSLKQLHGPVQLFDPFDHSGYPRYRLMPDDPHADAWPTGTFATNNLGYRGPDVAPTKPARTLRVVFVGASTTIEHPSFPLTHPDYVGHYLNLWARARGLDVTFETINAAREGFESTDLAAVVEQEVIPLAPDIVVYKEGANQFSAAKRMLTIAASAVKPIAADFIANGVIGGAAADYYSDERRRLDLLVARFRPVGEASRPPYVVNWPAGLSEEQPDLSRADLPLDLPVILNDLGQIHSAVRAVGADLAVSSFVWLAEEGLRLVPGRANERSIYWYLNGNDVFWPLKYRDIRRFTDFQNRVFQQFCKATGESFVDLARWFPRDPALFIDAVHLSYAGVKLHGWITFLQLLPLVEQRLASHASAKAEPADRTPAFSTMTVAEIQKQQQASALPLPLPLLSAWRAADPTVRLTLDDSRLLVQGGGKRWSYQIVSPDISVEPETAYQVTIPTRVTTGTIGVGVLDQSGNTWISSPVDAAPFTFLSGANTKIRLVVADATPAQAIPKPSVFEVRQAPR
jgi:hypothetical protein